MLKTRNARVRQNRKGQGLLEYAFLIAGIAFISLLALSVFGHKLSDQYAISAGMLPGAHDEDNVPIASQTFLETTENADGAIVGTGVISWGDITGQDTSGGDLINNVGNAGDGVGGGEIFVAD
jgi:hypothetical protein